MIVTCKDPVYFLTFLNLGKVTFQSSYRMYLRYGLQNNIKVVLIYEVFRVWFGKNEKISLEPLTIVLVSIVVRLQRRIYGACGP
jgi:hypothetical protein